MLKHLTFLLPLAAAFALTACDEIDNNERWGENQLVIAKKNVLIEDFTGQKCVNCPNASALIHELQGANVGEHIVAVSIHGGSMSFNIDKNPLGLATAVGDEYNNHWNVASWPNGMVDRKGGLQEYTAWKTSVAERLQCEPAVGIGVKSDYTYDSSGKTAGSLDITVDLAETDPGKLGNAHLTVWITESFIFGFQYMPDGSLSRDYQHQHVLRDCLTANYGDAVQFDSEGQAAWHKTYSIPLKYGINPNRPQPNFMHVVAFVTDDTTGEVLQVVEEPAAYILN